LSSQGKLRILLVEDEWIIAFRLEEIVREMGFEPAGPIPSVRQALALIDEEPIGVAILDVSLGSGEKCFPVAKALMAKDIPFLFVSGYQERDLPPDFAGVPICPKPYTEDTLRSALAKLGIVMPDVLHG
jgi:DNA-binding NtrC family response regulator